MSNTRNLAGLLNSSGLVPLPTKVAGVLPDANAPSGSVIQVVQGIKTDTSSYTSSGGNYGVSGLNVSITPTSASSKFLVIYNAHIGSNQNQRNGTLLQRNIGGGGYSEIFIANSAGSRLRSTSSNSPHSPNAITVHSASYLDTPNTTSVLNYRVLMGVEGNQNVHMNRSHEDTNNNTQYRAVSSITVMEIAA